VAWLENRNGLRFGNFGTVVSSGSFQLPGPRNSPEASLEICLQPSSPWHSGTLLTIYKPGNLFQFSLHQLQTDLLMRTDAPDDPHHARMANLRANDVFRRRGPIFITITAGVEETRVYIDGVLAGSAPHFPVSAVNFTGQLILGDSPRQTDNWAGQFFGLAIYHQQLTAAQVFHHYATWKQPGRPKIGGDEHNFALYLFDEHIGNVVRDKARSGVDLYIPERYTIMNKIALEPFWIEFNTHAGYWKEALKNIVGFVPFGFCFYAYLVALPSVKRPALLTLVLGAGVSLTIEVLQAFLPTRQSGTTDLVTNTLGTWVGMESYNLLTPVLVRFFPPE